MRNEGLCQGIDDHDHEALADLEASHSTIRIYDAGDVVYVQGEPATHVFNLVTGWVALHRDMPDGRRQIVHFLRSGRLFGLEQAGREMGHGATAITNAAVCPIARSALDELRRKRPSVNERYIEILQDERRQSLEMLTTLGQGSAKERIGRLLSALVLTAAGEGPILAGMVIRVPLTQRHIAEATGLTSIHVNRVLRQFREALAFEFLNGLLRVIDPGKLYEFCEQDLQRPGLPSLA